jgi:hypothetical protein
MIYLERLYSSVLKSRVKPLCDRPGNVGDEHAEVAEERVQMEARAEFVVHCLIRLQVHPVVLNTVT